MSSKDAKKAPEQMVWEAHKPTPTSEPLTLKCYCGLVEVELPCTPNKLNECRCSVCYSYGALWAYYRRGDVMVTTAAEPVPGVSLQKYMRDDEEADGDLAFYRCSHCGCTTHWWGEEDSPKRSGPAAKMGVNCRMLGEKGIEGIERLITYC